MNDQAYKSFLLNYMEILETLVGKVKDEKSVSELRIAERSFNFLLNYFPPEQVRTTFGMEEWNNLKKRRDILAAKISDMIDSDPRLKARYIAYCDNLRDPRSLGSML